MNDFDHLKNVANAKISLADNLKDGTIVLFLGAGASKGFGLPNWVELINFLRKKENEVPLPDDTAVDTLQRAADAIQRKIGDDLLKDYIQECFYDNKVKSNISDSLKNTLLVSISALLMGSKRGHISKVVTLNYDDMLEWFLSLFGFCVKTISNLPDLEGSEDVRIYHPHGFIPNQISGKLRSEGNLILGLASANRRLGTPGDLWFEKVRDILNSGVCLFLGMSANTLRDRALAPLFQTCGEGVMGERPLGIWILSKEEMKDPTIEGEFDSVNIIPLSFSSFEEIPEFLLEICQIASRKIA